MNVFHSATTDRWLTPPELVEALGPFDLDPCCEPWMPWRTAARMLSLSPASSAKQEGFQSEIRDGLCEDWGTARAWVNPPYSGILPWVYKFVAHGNGIMLTAAKSPDTKWGQELLGTFDLALFLAGRLLFRYPDGGKPAGKWLPNVLWAYGEENCAALERLRKEAWPGVLVTRRERR